MPRVKPFVQDIGGFALATTIDAADQHDHREFACLQHIVLGIQQGFAQHGQALFVFFALYLVTDFGRFKHAGSPLMKGVGPPGEMECQCIPMTSTCV